MRIVFQLSAPLVKAVDKKTEGITSLFDEPAETPVSTPAASPAASAPVPAARFAPPIPETPSIPKASGKPRASVSLNSLFDETLHPRAGEGASVMNPETGKVSHGGQFAPGLMHKNDTGSKEQDNGSSSDSTPAGNGSPGAAVDSVGQGEPSGVVPEAKSERHFNTKRKRSSESVPGTSNLFDFDGGEPSGSTTVGSTNLFDSPGAGPIAGPVGYAGLTPPAPDAPPADPAELTPIPAAEVASGVHTFSLSEVKTGNDYRITDSDQLGEGTDRQKFWDNYECVRLLKTIQAEGRNATPEEQAKLVKYTGWGWAQAIFNRKADSEASPWFKEKAALRALLSPSEWEAASGSVLNAHFTSPEVIEAVWDAVGYLGFKGGRVLEPSAGVGHFFGLMPAKMAARSRLSAVELEPLTAGITEQLYQSANVQACGFEKAVLPDDYFDLAISNVPFGAYGVFDEEYNKPGSRWITERIHNYFFAKALDKVRPGGLVAFITSTGTMDAKTNQRMRDYLGESADFLGAIRLPNTAFKANAGTEVTTDCIFLRKRVPGEKPDGESWSQSVPSGVNNDNGEELPINEYFHRKPNMLCGELVCDEMYAGRAGGRLGLDPSPHATTGIGAQMRYAVQHEPTLNRVVYSSTGEKHEATDEAKKRERIPPPGDVKIGGYGDVGGVLMIREVHGMVPCVFQTDEDGNVIKDAGGNPLRAINLKAEARIRGMIGLRDKLRALHRLQLEPNASDAEIATMRFTMAAAYDQFKRAYGPIHSRANLIAFGSDPDAAYIAALEDYNPETGEATRGDALTKRTLYPHQPVTSADTPKDAMLVAMNESGRLDFDHMARLLGKTPDDVIAALHSEGHIFHDPNGDWEQREAYLCGDVKAKLRQAEAAATLDPMYRANVEALTSVLPPDLTPADITVQLGAGFVPPQYVQDFIHHLIGVPEHDRDRGGAKVSYHPAIGEWTVEEAANAYTNNAASKETWGTSRITATELINLSLNMRYPVIRDRHPDDPKKTIVNKEDTEKASDKLQAIHDEWERWLFSDPERTDHITQIYNDTMNCHAQRTFDGSHLQLPGLSDHARENMNPHVKNAIWRQLQTPNTLLAHAVGAGKTWEAICGAMEQRRLGIAKKPLITVPNHIVGQWAKDFQDLYPGAKVLTATKKDFEKGNRRRFLARIAHGDWDAVVIAHSSFGKLPVSKEREKAFYDEQINGLMALMNEEAEENGKKSPSFKALQKAKKSMERKLDKRMASREKNTDDFMEFEELGVDSLYVDEAHMFKNLYFPTKLQRIKGINPDGSDRAMDMLLKCRHIQDTSGGRGVVFLTGTPVSNSLSECYTMERYLDPKGLERKGLTHFDAWAKQHATRKRELESSPTGKMKMTVRLSQFVNLPELNGRFRGFTDVLLDEDLKLPRPDVNRIVHECPMSDSQRTYINELSERAEAISGPNPPPPEEDNMLKITSDGRKNTLDARLVSHDAEDHPDTKINTAVRAVLEDYHASHEINGTQIVFMDMGTPKADDDDDDEQPEEEEDDRDPIDKARDYVDGQSGGVKAWAEKWLDWRLGGMEGEEPHYTTSKFDGLPGTHKEQGRVTRGINKHLAPTVSPEEKRFRKQIKKLQEGKLEIHRRIADAYGEQILEHLKNHEGSEEKERPDFQTIEGTPSRQVEEALHNAYFGEDQSDAIMRNSLYAQMKQKMVAAGIPKEQIAFIHSANTDVAKLKLLQAVKKGQIRVLLGSTEKLGTGANVQDRLCAIHHMDCPWRPSDRVQREGRGIRKGNMNKSVNIHEYVTKGDSTVSFDGFLWQLIKTKGATIDQVMKGDPSLRTTEDVGDAVLHASQMIAIASGNPLIEERYKLEAELNRLGRLRHAHEKEQFSNRHRVKSLPNEIRNINDTIKQIEAAKAHRDKFKPGEGQKPVVTVNGKAYEKHDEGVQAMLAELQTVGNESMRHVGTYNGFDVIATRDKPGYGFTTGEPRFMLTPNHKLAINTDRGATVQNAWYASTQPTDTGQGTAARFDRAINGHLDDLHTAKIRSRQQAENDLNVYSGSVSEFPHEQKYIEGKARLREIDKILGADKEDANVHAYDDGGGEEDSSDDDDENVPMLSKAFGAAAGIPGLATAAKQLGVRNPQRVNTYEAGVSEPHIHVDAHDAPFAAAGLRNHLRLKGFKVGGSTRYDDNAVSFTAHRGGTAHVFHVAHSPIEEPAKPAKPENKPAANPQPAAAEQVAPPAPPRTLGEAPRRSLTMVLRGKLKQLGQGAKPAEEAAPEGSRYNFSQPRTAAPVAASPAPAAATPAAAAEPAEKKKRAAAAAPLNVPQGNLDATDHAIYTKYTKQVLHGKKALTPTEESHFRDLHARRLGLPGEAATHSPTATTPVTLSKDSDVGMPVRAKSHSMELHQHEVRDNGGQVEHSYLLSHRNPSRGVDSMYKRLHSQGYELSPVTFQRQKVDGRLKHLYRFTIKDRAGAVHLVHVIRPRNEDSGTIPKTYVGGRKHGRRPRFTSTAGVVR